MSALDWRTEIATILDDAQSSEVTHDRNYVNLLRIHIRASVSLYSSRKTGVYNLDGEIRFKNILKDFLLRFLSHSDKKSASYYVKTIIKFFAGYVSYINNKAELESEASKSDVPPMVMRFTKFIIQFLLKGFETKNKIVRQRCLHLWSLISNIGELDQDDYQKLRCALIKRTSDKDIFIRTRAVISLSKFIGTENDKELEDFEETEFYSSEDVLCHVLANDPSPEVRRTALKCLPVHSATLEQIILRSKDKDSSVRRALFLTTLRDNIWQQQDDGRCEIGPTHPTVLSIEQRETLVRNGLKDREATVRNAATQMMNVWADLLEAKCRREVVKIEDEVKVENDTQSPDTPKINALICLLELFVLDEGPGLYASDVLKSIFETRSDFFEALIFTDSYWRNPSIESVFLARTFVEYCEKTDQNDRMDSALPSLTEIYFVIEKLYIGWASDVCERTEDESQEWEDSIYTKRAILLELLKMAGRLDYSDKYGRDRMKLLLHSILGGAVVTDELINSCMDILVKIYENGRELLQDVIKIIGKLCTPDVQTEYPEREVSQDSTELNRIRSFSYNKPFSELTADQRERSDENDLRCLRLVIAVLERTFGSSEDASGLGELANNLIYPCIDRQDAPLLQERGLNCLGLCSLIDVRTAQVAVPGYISSIPQLSEDLQVLVLKSVFDILMVHTDFFLGNPDQAKTCKGFLFDLLGASIGPSVQALLGIGISKLVLADTVFDDNETIQNLMMVLISPATIENIELRQGLTFFFSAYSFSSKERQQSMFEIFYPMLEELQAMEKDPERTPEDELVTIPRFLDMFLSWTDPVKAREIRDLETVDVEIQVELAKEIIRALMFHGENLGPRQKDLCRLLNKLHLPNSVDDDRIRHLKFYLHKLRVNFRMPSDSKAKEILNRFEITISEKYAPQLADFSSEEYKILDRLAAKFDDLDMLNDEDEGHNEDASAQSVAIGKRPPEEEISHIPEGRDQSMNRAKRRRTSTAQGI